LPVTDMGVPIRNQRFPGTKNDYHKRRVWPTLRLLGRPNRKLRRKMLLPSMFVKG